jgi:prolipoprotein diacylglyceryltransferase
MAITFFIRFAVEFFRVSEKVIFNIGTTEISTAHLTSSTLLICGIIGLVWREKKLEAKN